MLTVCISASPLCVPNARWLMLAFGLPRLKHQSYPTVPAEHGLASVTLCCRAYGT